MLPPAPSFVLWLDMSKGRVSIRSPFRRGVDGVGGVPMRLVMEAHGNGNLARATARGKYPPLIRFVESKPAL